MYQVQFAQKALIVEDGCALMIQKSADDAHNPLRWEVPGGRLKSGESLEEHLAREILEEVGLEIVSGRPLAIWTWHLGTEADAPQIVAVLRHCVQKAGTINFDGHDKDDHIGAWQWVPLREVSSLDLIPNARDAILTGISQLEE